MLTADGLSVTRLGDGVYRVVRGGHGPHDVHPSHAVRFMGRGDDDEALWECDCAGYRYRGECAHLRAVWSVVEAECVETGQE